MGLKKGDTLTFTAANQTQTMQKGKIVLDPGKRMPWLTFEVALTLANAGGSPVTLSATQLQNFLATWKLLVKYGLGVERVPYNNIDFFTLRQVSRNRLGTDWPFILDTTQGFGAAIPNGGTLAVKFYLQIPLGYDFTDDALKDLWGIGPAQAASMSIAVQRGADTLPANITISGNVTMQLIYTQRDAKFEQYDFFEEYMEPSDSKNIVDVADGLTRLLAEKSATSAASSLTSVAVRVAGVNQHYNVNPQEIVQEFIEDPELPSSANISDTYTVLLGYNTRYRTRDQAPGVCQFEQLVKNLNNYTLAHLYRPIVPEAAIYAEVTALAKALNREVRVCSLAAALGVPDVPDWLKQFLPWAVLSAQDGDAINVECIRATPTMPARLYVPPTRLGTIKDNVSHLKRNNAPAANNAVAKVLANVPGATPSPTLLKSQPVPQPSMSLSALQAAIG